ncbi:MAG: hypothetical protein K6E29_07685 [Cyanobacteria bacterium RUI128]|nr:hypothetical protein [Cyanobacteria bacterium RUI128]
MKKIFLICLILLMGLNIPVNAGDKVDYINNVINNEQDIVSSSISESKNCGVSKDVWVKYFDNQAGKIRKVWKTNKALFKDKKYDTSYARVLIVANNTGKVCFKIKSYCVPFYDEEFLKCVENTVKSLKLNPPPAGYGCEYLAFTIKFHSKLPKKINSQNIDWEKCGIADIEVNNKQKEVVFNRK